MVNEFLHVYIVDYPNQRVRTETSPLEYQENGDLDENADYLQVIMLLMVYECTHGCEVESMALVLVKVVDVLLEATCVPILHTNVLFHDDNHKSKETDFFQNTSMVVHVDYLCNEVTRVQ